MNRARLIGAGAVGVVLVAGLSWALWPEPVPVDVVTVRVAPMEVTVAAEGVSRVRDPYLVTAPIAGTLVRSPVAVGDRVIRDETVIAAIRPAEPALLDARARAEAEATVAEARAAVVLAQVNLARAEVDRGHAEADLERNRALAARGVIPQRILDDSVQQAESLRAAVEAAASELAMREATLSRAEAVLTGPELRATLGPGDCCTRIVAPQSGTVLWLEDASARLVQAGTPLMTIGDLDDLEIEVDLLSADAVRLAPGARARVERWGGPDALEARLLRIDPRGFARVSALGIEEQRVKGHLELLSPPEARAGLGDAYRVFVRIIEWESPAALQIPVSALVRADGGWAVFRVADGRARLAPVEIGRRTQTEAELLSGLDEGDRVVAFPGDRIADGTRVVQR